MGSMLTKHTLAANILFPSFSNNLINKKLPFAQEPKKTLAFALACYLYLFHIACSELRNIKS